MLFFKRKPIIRLSVVAAVKPSATPAQAPTKTVMLAPRTVDTDGSKRRMLSTIENNRLI